MIKEPNLVENAIFINHSMDAVILVFKLKILIYQISI